jgi:competence protein ComEC
VLRRAGARLSARRPLPWSWWLPALASGLLVGQTVAGAGDLPARLLIVAAALAAPAARVLHRAAATAALLATVAASVGVAQVAWWQRARERHAAALPASTGLVRGRVREVRSRAAQNGTTRVALELVATDDQDGLARGERFRLTVWSSRRRWRVGDLVGVRTALRPPRGFCNGGDDGYARAMWRAGVLAVAAVASDRQLSVDPGEASLSDPYAQLAAARGAIGDAIARAVPGDDERAVLRALVIGDQSEIGDELRRAYARTGTAHVLSVSGLHIALVAMTAYALLHALLVRWPRLALRVLVARVAAGAALVPTAFYALLSGGAVATLRSLVMGGLGLGAVVLLRRSHVWTALAAAALLLAAADPDVAGDVSFQLSFASVRALVVAGQRFEAWRDAGERPWLGRHRLLGRALGLLLAAIVASSAASLVTAPITAYHFGSVALIGVFANLVIVPWVGGAVLLLVLAGAALLPLSASAASVLLWSAGVLLHPANQLVEQLGAWRWAALDLVLASPAQVLALVALGAALLLPAGSARHAAIALAAALALVVVGETIARRGEPQLVVHFLDVGQGDATLLELPASARGLVVDGGGLGGSFDTGERVLLPALRRAGLSRLSAVALTHPERDHYGGLTAVVRALAVQELWSNGRDAPGVGYRELIAALRSRGVVRRDLVDGDQPLPAGADGQIQVLHPPRGGPDRRGNDASLVLRLDYGAIRVLLTGDAEAAAERSLLRRGDDPGAGVVKVGHHGSRTSSTQELLLATRPSLAVAMLGERNRFGFPAPEVRARYEALGAAWLETDGDGAVAVASDGQLARVTSCRGRVAQ